MMNHLDVSHLVSICVITYNSSKYVIETLNSLLLQTYHPLEVIVSDDCSTDNTPSICQEWVNRNKHNFVRCIFLKHLIMVE